ncbi:MAG: putative MAPEG superfamily protein, partial [Candidatus Paceibacteria bacterium]
MTVELTMLVFSVGLLLVILLGQGTLGVLSNGLAAQAGPRDGLPGPSVVHARVTRLRANMIENLLLFAPIV